ncbi:hypothetical protein H7H78_16220 [Mycobacterium shinjukuense]|uniref:hypothetical protein n=1 Tax=Mycobacterium shinjukuense TaxID=398694 RepID=UPI0021F26201|nr:hypothetical protein [Mycobacterium shinjukuense]MCV6986905.1 hypothetical protein [Mycobacterium shinjukuense]
MVRAFPLHSARAFGAGELAATLRRGGQDIGQADCLREDICLNVDLPFATRHRKHFARVTGLRRHDVADDA